MHRRLIVSLVLAVALSSCSRSDDRAAGNGVQQHDLLRPGIGAQDNDTARMPVAQPGESTGKVAAVAEPKASQKQRHGSAGKHSKRAQSVAARRWNAFQAAMERCVAVPLTAREGCLAEGRDAFRSAKIDCAALPAPERKECVKYSKLWQDTEVDVPTAAATRDEQPALSAPDDRHPAELTRDGSAPSHDVASPSEDETTAN